MSTQKIILFFFFLLFLQSSQAQFTTFNFGAGTVNNIILNLKHPKLKLFGTTIERSIKESYHSNIGINLLLSTDYTLTPKWTLRSGFNYLQFDFKHEIDGIILGTDIMNGTSSSMKASGSRKEIGAFLDAFFRPKHKYEKKAFYIFTGLAFRKVITTDIERVWYGGAASDPALYGKQYSANAFNTSTRLGLKFDFELSQKWHLALLPYADYLLKGDEFIIFNFKKDRILNIGLLLEISLTR